MKKLFNLRNALIFCFVIIISLTAVTVNTNIRLKDTEELIAERSFNDWNSLSLLAEKAKNIKNWDISEFYIYENSVIYNAAFNLYPVYIEDGISITEFLSTDYDQFVLDMSANKLPYDEAVEVFLQVNAELKELCKNASSFYEDNRDSRTELLDTNSKASKAINKQITEFTERNSRVLKDFRNSLS